MDTRKIAIACQGGGIHGAFTCGVLDRILKTKEDEENAATLPRLWGRNARS
jgi:predicted patatin/cPLA2 family phospholipase